MAQATPVESPGTPDVPALLAALDDGAPAERLAAARALSDRPAAAEPLGRALGHEQDPAVRAVILEALSRIGGGAAAAALAPHLGSEDAALRSGAIEALQSLGEAGGDEIEPLLRDPDPDKRIFALNVLESLRDPRAIGWLRDALVEENELNVALAAVEALAGIGGPDDTEPLRAFAARHPDVPFVEFAVDLACRRMGAT